MAEGQESFERLLAIWNGDAEPGELSSILSLAYRGRIGSRERDAAGLARDIAALRERFPGVRFAVEHGFGDGECLASRLTAHVPGPAGASTVVRGMNVSRWEDGLLAEEWAVWEAFPAG